MFNYDLLSYLEGFLTAERKERFLQVLSQRTRFLTVAVEDVYQMHNTSAILRSCDAFGIQQMHVVAEKFESKMDKKIALGAQKWVDIDHYDTSQDCIQHLKQSGHEIVATTPRRNAEALSNFKITSKCALFFGTEKEGLSQAVLQQADRFLQIPMVGFTESLNVSVSAAIVLFSLTNRLRGSDLPWQLEETEVLDKRMDWTKKSIKNVEQIIDRYPGK